MFSSENLLGHFLVSTLELKNFNPRWYTKEAVISDRALYLYKVGSNYVHDAHQRLKIGGYKCQILHDLTMQPYAKDLPPLDPEYNTVAELVNKDNLKRKLMGFPSDQKAAQFLEVFNLVASFSTFDTAVEEQIKNNKSPQKGMIQQPLIANREERKRIERWVKSYVIKTDERDSREFSFLNEHVNPNLLSILDRFFMDSVVALRFQNNQIGDSKLNQNLLPFIQSFKRLRTLELSNNRLGCQSLDTLTFLFQENHALEDLILSQNYIGALPHELAWGGSVGGAAQGEKLAVDQFLLSFLTELDNPCCLDLSGNQLTDESLYPIVKYVFANYDCRLKELRLQNNAFTPFASRTILKAFAISPNKDSLKFEFGSLPLNFPNLKSGFVTRDDFEQGYANHLLSFHESRLNETKLNDSQKSSKDSKAVASDASKYFESKNVKCLEVSIKRKSNNFWTSSGQLRQAPVSLMHMDEMESIFKRIENIIQRRDEIEIEEIREFVSHVTSLELKFEFPRFRMEPIFNVINEKLELAMKAENIYIMEVLLDCLKFMNARNIPAEKKYYELANQAQDIASSLLLVLNMDIHDEREMMRKLVKSLKRAKQIGMRGQLIDAARHLYLMTDKILNEMRGKQDALSDEDSDAIYEVNEEDRPSNVYDESLDKFIGLDAEALGLTSDFEINLATHPYSTDYLAITNLNFNYLKKNMFESRKFIKDEENYAYRNIFERCSFIMSDAKESSQDSITYNLARNDVNLKLVRLVFRFRCNADEFFEQKFLRPFGEKEPCESRLWDHFEVSQKAIKTIQALPELREGGKMIKNFSAVTLKQSIVSLEDDAQRVSLGFNARLGEVLRGSLTNQESKTRLFAKLQTLVTDFVLIWHSQPSDPNAVSKNPQLLNILRYPLLADEFYLQLYRLGLIYAPKPGAKPDKRELFIVILAMRVLSLYFVPPSVPILEGIMHWLVQQRKQTSPTEGLNRIMLQILTAFKQKLEETQDDSQEKKQEGKNIEIVDQNSGAKLSNFEFKERYWPPCLEELESIFIGRPLEVTVSMTNGEIITEEIDENTTVESLMERIERNKECSLYRESETEGFWLYIQTPLGAPAPPQKLLELQTLLGNEGFDFPLPKDKRIMKLKFQLEQIASKVGLSWENLGPSLVIKRRIFSSLYPMNNFKKLSRKQLDTIFNQVRRDYIERCILKDMCHHDDIIYLAALLLKFKLQAKILRSKTHQIAQDLLVKNLDYAVPSAIIDQGSNPHPKSQKVMYWVSRIEEKYFRKKDFIELSTEDCQVKFLSNASKYQLIFGNYYVLYKDFMHRREAEQSNLLSLLASKRQVLANDDSSNNRSSDEEAESDEFSARKRGNQTISEARSNEEEDSDGSQSRKEKSQGSGRQSNQESKISSKKAQKATKEKLVNEQNFWTQFSDNKVLVVVSFTGIMLLDVRNKESVLYHIDYEDVIYVTAKGNKLKLGYVHHHQLMDQVTSSDTKVELTCEKDSMMKAKVIAEDIISYCQLRLGEMTQNQWLEFSQRHSALHHNINQDGPKKEEQDKSLERSVDTAEGQKRMVRNLSNDIFKDMRLEQGELLDSDDIDSDEQNNFMAALGKTKQTDDTKFVESKILTEGEKYAEQINKQLGSVIKFRQLPFFVFRRKCPLNKGYWGQPGAPKPTNVSTELSSQEDSDTQSELTPPQTEPESSKPQEQEQAQSLPMGGNIPSTQLPAPARPNLANFMQELNQLHNSTDSSQNSSIEKNARSAPPEEASKPLLASPIPPIPQSPVPEKPKVNLQGIKDKSERENQATNILQQALMMAPPI